MATLGLAREAAWYHDSADYHKETVERFTRYVNEDAELKAHRDFIETEFYGFGERAFHWR